MLALAACTAVQRCRRFSHCDVLLRVARPHLTKPDQSLCCLAPSGFPCRRRRQRHHFHPLWRLGGILRASPDACSLMARRTRTPNPRSAIESVQCAPSFLVGCRRRHRLRPSASFGQPRVLLVLCRLHTQTPTNTPWPFPPQVVSGQAPHPPHTSLLHLSPTLTANTVLHR